MYTDYVVHSVKLPRELREKIKKLAASQGVTVNAWILRRLAREARWGEHPKK